MTKTLYGKIHGKTIELEEDLGVLDALERVSQHGTILANPSTCRQE
jgi:hypothetical protein